MKRFATISLIVALCLGGCANVGTDTGSGTPEPSPPAPSGSADGLEGGSAAPDSVPSAAEYIEGRLEEFDRVLYVYKDFSDGANCWTQRAWAGERYSDVPEMREDAEGLGGSTGIAAEIDLTKHAWGGYSFLLGGENGENVPMPDAGMSAAGFDLTGAETLAFYAKGENGERVKFFMGDGSGDAPYADSADTASLYATLSDEWECFEIPLEGLDLSRITCGFGWVADAASNPGAETVRFCLDDIRYEFPEARLQPLFLTSYAPALPGTDDAIINNVAYLYDNAAAAMALSYAGKHARARQIADALVYALNDRYFTDGRLRNAYIGGNPQSPPGWYSARGLEFARLPGFYDPDAKEYFEDAYAVSTSAGNCAWAILALLEVRANAPERDDYLDAARKIADFVLTLESGDGFTGGYEGWEPSQAESGQSGQAELSQAESGQSSQTESGQTKASYKSTEHNVDLVAAFGRLSTAEGVSEADGKKYADASESAKAFVLSMYDAEKGCFYAGTTGADGAAAGGVAGTAADGVTAANGVAGTAADGVTAADGAAGTSADSAADTSAGGVAGMAADGVTAADGAAGTADGATISKDVIPLDCQTWTLCVLGDAFGDSAKVLRFVEEHMAADGGYGFQADSKGVWNEGTAQMGIVCRLTGDAKKSEEILEYLNASRLPDGSITAADRNGVSTGFMVSGTGVPWEYGQRQHLGATAWLSFLQQDGRNPFAY